MKKILILNSAVIAKDSSKSTAIKNKFVAEYQKLNPKDKIIELNLSEVEIANTTLNQENINLFFNQENSLKYIEQLKNVDKVLVVTPMINFNISPLLKNYLDHIVVANQTFSYTLSQHPEGIPVGLLDNLKVQIIITKGSPKHWYTEFFDLPNYLVNFWSFLGAKVNEPLVVAGVDMPPLATMKPNEIVSMIDLDIKKAVMNF